MIKNRLHLSPLPAVNTSKNLFYFSPNISSSVKVLTIRVPTAKHSYRNNCSIVLFIPYYVLLTSICYASISPGLPTTYPWVRWMGQTHRPMGHERPMARNSYIPIKRGPVAHCLLLSYSIDIEYTSYSTSMGIGSIALPQGSRAACLSG